MYTSFYNLHLKPFQISSDPSFMWSGEKHKEALATLKYGILDNKGFLLLTGDVGTGKTTLINALIQSLSDDIICTSVPDPGLEKLDFFNYIAAGFGIEKEFTTKGSFLAHFKQFLLKTNEAGKKALLIIDEAQLLTQEMLEEIRLLSNIEKTDAKLINIFFIGQNEFNEILNREQNRAVRQRLTLNYNIDPLTPEETGEYIRHRILVAGSSESIFDDDATKEVFFYSGGFPRRINVICDHCLLSGYVNNDKTITDRIVRECAKELSIPAYIRNRNINGFEHNRQSVSPSLRSQGFQVPLPEDKPMKKSGGGRKFFSGLLICILFVAAGWFFTVSENAIQSRTLIGEYAVGIRDKLLQTIPEQYIPSLKKKGNPGVPDIQAKEENQDRRNKTGEQNERSEESEESEEGVEGDTATSLETVFPIVRKKGTAGSKEKPVEALFEKKIIDENPVIEVEQDKELSTELMAPSPVSGESSTVQKALPDNNKTRHDTSPIPDNELETVKIQKEAAVLSAEKLIIRFKHNSNDFTIEGIDKLNKFSDLLILHPGQEIIITGYTDSEGAQAYNKRLSEFRANIVKSFFLGKGIGSDRIAIQGAGSKNPIEPNDTSWGRMMNRRVEIELKKE